MNFCFKGKIRRNSHLWSTELLLKKPQIFTRIFARNFDEGSLEQKAKIAHFPCVTSAQYCTFNIYLRKVKWILLNDLQDEVEAIIQQSSLGLRRMSAVISITSIMFSNSVVNVFCTILCKSNASEMPEFRFLFSRTFFEISCESSNDNSRLFERIFRWKRALFRRIFASKWNFSEISR